MRFSKIALKNEFRLNRQVSNISMPFIRSLIQATGHNLIQHQSNSSADIFPTLIMELSIEEYQETVIESFNSSNELACDLASDHFEHISRFIFNSIIREINQMDALLKNINTFDAEAVVKLTVDAVIQKIALGDSEEHPKQHIHYAPTQSGKSAFKAVMICTYLIMNMPVIVVTKGGGESKELAGKISSYFKGSRFEDRIFSSSDVERNDNRLNIAFSNDEEASALIVLDSHQKIERSHDFLSGTMEYAKERGRRIAGCALIIDEVDAVVDRSEDQDEENEKAMKKLISDLKPFLVMVTATPIPVFSICLDKKPIITTSYEQIENYVGVKDMVLFDDLDQDSLYGGFGDDVGKFKPKYDCDDRKQCERAALFPADISQIKDTFPMKWNKKNPRVPRINSQCIKLLRKEMDKKDAVGMLALVATTPKVDASDNIFEQAAGIQDYFAERKRKMIPIVVHSTHVYYRLPGQSYSFKCSRSFSELLDEIDSNKKYGLDMPVVVFGYFAMKRSRSFRSEQRVPTCMIMSLGKGQSNENCRQAAGRLTFKGQDVLKRNRKTEKVLMLCPEDDYVAIQKYDRLVKEIIDHYAEKASSWKDMCSDLERCSNNYYLNDSKRRTGNYVPGKSRKKKKGQPAVPRSANKHSVKKVAEASSLSVVANEPVESNVVSASSDELDGRKSEDSSVALDLSSRDAVESSSVSGPDQELAENINEDSGHVLLQRKDRVRPSLPTNAPEGILESLQLVTNRDSYETKHEMVQPNATNDVPGRSPTDEEHSSRGDSSLSDSSDKSCVGEEEPLEILGKRKRVPEGTVMTTTGESCGWRLDGEEFQENWNRITSIETIERSANDHKVGWSFN